MQLRVGASVVSADGNKVGELDRVVIDPRTKDVTHLIVRKGLLFTADKVVPIDQVRETDAERIELKASAGDLERLPDYLEEHYIVAEEREWVRNPELPAARPPADLPASVAPTPTVYWYPPLAADFRGFAPGAPNPYGDRWTTREQTEVQRNIPDSTVPLKEGARVHAADGAHIGNVERVFTDPGSNRVTHLVISRGLLLKQRKVVPMAWVADFSEDDVRLAVGSELLQSVREWEEHKE